MVSGFCISDCTKLEFDCLPESLMAKTGESSAFYFPNMKNSIVHLPGTYIQKILILVEPSFLLSFMEEDMEYAPFESKALLNASRDVYEPYHSTDIVTPSMRVIVEQIFNCPYEGVTRRIFIEGKAMELIACKLTRSASPMPTGKATLSRSRRP